MLGQSINPSRLHRFRYRKVEGDAPAAPACEITQQERLARKAAAALDQAPADKSSATRPAEELRFSAGPSVRGLTKHKKPLGAMLTIADRRSRQTR
jgi:hypothetical protein